ncbi:DUF1707 SHOCT-like domain-containing protein [Streptomyces olivaceoviridis]
MSDDAVPDLRASDADRDRVAGILRDALAEGRLDMGEFDERLEAAYKARTYGELAPLIRDLPVPGAVAPALAVSFVKSPVAEGGWAGRITGTEGSSTGAVAILSGFGRKGRWTVPRRFSCFTFMGGGELDLREADFAAGEVEIQCVVIMGGVQVIVPPGVEVVVRGIGVMGAFEYPRDDGPPEPGAPRVIIGGLAFWGGVGVARKLPRGERKRLGKQR